MPASFGGGACPPGCAALLTRMSIPPSAATATPTAARTDASSPVSICTGTTVWVLEARRAPAAASRRPMSRAAIATSTPSATRARATAKPMPRLPPVISALRPRSCRSIGLGLPEGAALPCWAVWSPGSPGPSLQRQPGRIGQGDRGAASAALLGRREHPGRRERAQLAISAPATDHFDPLIAGGDVAHVGHELPGGGAQPRVTHVDCVPLVQSGPLRGPEQVARRLAGGARPLFPADGHRSDPPPERPGASPAFPTGAPVPDDFESSVTTPVGPLASQGMRRGGPNISLGAPTTREIRLDPPTPVSGLGAVIRPAWARPRRGVPANVWRVSQRTKETVGSPNAP